MWLRKLHRYLGLCLSPLILVTALAGGVLLWRRSRAIDFETRKALTEWHNYEAIGNYVGVVVAAGLVAMVITGWALWLQAVLRKRRSRKGAD